MELSWDYHASTDDAAESELATCLCGSNQCRGSFLPHEQTSRHSPAEMEQFLKDACTVGNALTKQEESVLLSAGFGRRIFPKGSPIWLKRFCARVITYLSNHHNLSLSDWRHLAVMAVRVLWLLTNNGKLNLKPPVYQVRRRALQSRPAYFDLT